MREPQSFNSTMELMSCDLLQFIAMYHKKKELHSCDGMKLYLSILYKWFLPNYISSIDSPL